jgi:hypothetical protein
MSRLMKRMVSEIPLVPLFSCHGSLRGCSVPKPEPPLAPFHRHRSLESRPVFRLALPCVGPKTP